MRIAVCYSGQLRSGPRCLEHQRRFFGDLLPHIDFFVHTWDINSNKRFDFGNGQGNCEMIIPEKIIADYLHDLSPKMSTIEHWNGWLAWRNRPFHPQIYSFIQSISLKNQFESKAGITYDVAVKMRPDLLIHPSRKLSDEVDKAISMNSFLIENIGPSWKTDIFTDDVFYVAPNHLMNKVMDYSPGPSKTNLVNWLSNSGASIAQTAARAYTIYRKECYHLSPMDDFDACVECDYEYFVPSNKFRPSPDESPDYYQDK